MVVRFPTSAAYSPRGPLFNLASHISHWYKQRCGGGGWGETEPGSQCPYLMTTSKRSMRGPSSRPLRMPPLPTTTQRWHLCDLFLSWWAESERGSLNRKERNKQQWRINKLLVFKASCVTLFDFTLIWEVPTVHISPWKQNHDKKYIYVFQQLLHFALKTLKSKRRRI